MGIICQGLRDLLHRVVLLLSHRIGSAVRDTPPRRSRQTPRPIVIECEKSANNERHRDNRDDPLDWARDKGKTGRNSTNCDENSYHSKSRMPRRAGGRERGWVSVRALPEEFPQYQTRTSGDRD